MRLGLIKTSLIDFPECVSAVFFYPGCNLRCPYCHNPELLTGQTIENGIEFDDIESFFKKRAAVLDGIVITGGEPTLHTSLFDLVKLAKNYNLMVKLDTNGLRPDILALLEDIDFIAMDIKTLPGNYNRHLSHGISIPENTSELVLESIQYVLSSGIRHQFRTTLLKEIVNSTDMEYICTVIKGCDEYRLTRFRPGTTLIKDYTGDTSAEYINSIIDICRKNGINYKLE